MKLILNNKTLDGLKLELYKHLLRGISKKCFEYQSGKECYRLLIYLSQFIDNSILIDLGTSNGASAIALSTNPTNNVISFDIQDRTEISMIQSNSYEPTPYLNNIDYIVTKNFIRYINIFLLSPLIYVDIGHDGIFERKLFNILKQKEYRGIVIMDDIYDFIELKRLWEDIDIKKYDISKYGHHSGTGLIDFSNNLELDLQ